ncbi:hypothetical protein CWR43_28550 [Rhizobium sullae]|uniref:Uncharacterized protein n=1 Tax=Rhizobium sullae TaxID=50338 RepID=A0A2N0D354_RHISU|nr:hypothetical protein CWR43_28550 [Rhizobium sullae]
MGGETVSLLTSKTPPQPLPTRGRGYYAATLRNSLTANLAISTDADAGDNVGATSWPSPLWGGLGGVFSPTPNWRRPQ